MHMVAYVLAPGLDATGPTGLYINPRRRGRIAEGTGCSCYISSWARTSDNAIPIRLKCGANYQNGRLATLQSKADGYDEPIFLNQHGHVAEGTGASLFMVRKGRLVTPPVTTDILESITRTTLIDDIGPEMLRHGVERARHRPHRALRGRRGLLLRHRLRDHADLSIDRFPLGDGHVGPITQRLSTAYMNIVRGVDKRYPEWRTPVYPKSVKV